MSVSTLTRVMRCAVVFLTRLFTVASLMVSARAISAEAISPCAGPKVRVSENSVLVAMGDSLTWGAGRSSPRTGGQKSVPNERSPSPWPEALNTLLGSKVRVINLGMPGARSVDGLASFRTVPEASLYIIMFGTNDYLLTRAGKPSGVSLADYRATMRKLVEKAKSVAGSVIVLTPPPLQGGAGYEALRNYGSAALEVADHEGVVGVETFDFFPLGKIFWTDGLHLTPEGYRLIAENLACRIEVVH